jgi:hypothetical protein
MQNGGVRTLIDYRSQLYVIRSAILVAVVTRPQPGAVVPSGENNFLFRFGKFVPHSQTLEL